jgi:hypothetical protein
MAYHLAEHTGVMYDILLAWRDELTIDLFHSRSNPSASDRKQEPFIVKGKSKV